MGKANGKIKLLTSVVCLVIFLVACSRQQALPNWFCENWKSSYEDIAINENWKEIDDTLKGITIWSWDDTTKTEFIQVFFKKEKLIYRLESDRKKIDFTCVKPSSDTLVFINKSNDFPKRILYYKPKGNYMKVQIDNEERDPEMIIFNFKKD